MSSVSKLKNIELDDGWSFVTRAKAGKRPRKGKVVKTPAEAQLKQQRAPLDPKVVSDIVEDVDSSLEGFKQLEGIKNVLSQFSVGQNTASAFCLGLGPLSYGPSANQKRSLAQLAGFLWLLKHADMGSDTKIDGLQLHAIDPHFSATDGAVLEHFNIKSHLEATPEHAADVRNSLCYAPFLPWTALLLDYLPDDDNGPAVLVCQDVTAVKENLQMWTKQLKPNETIEIEGRSSNLTNLLKGIERCDNILKHYEGTRWPVYEALPFAFQDLMVYTRAPKADP